MAAYRAVRRFNVRERKCGVNCAQTLAGLFSTRAGVGATRAEDSLKDETERKKNVPKSFQVLQAERQAQAERSVLISCDPKTHEKKFLKYLSIHGNINKCFFYENFGTHALVEFSDHDGVQSLLESTAIPTYTNEFVVPLRSRVLSLRDTKTVGTKSQQAPQSQPQRTVSINKLILQLSSCSSIEQQIMSLTEAYSLTEENTRLRFLVCSLLNDIAAGYFPQSSIKPFGSSVNGFGKLGGDLDMFLDFNGIDEGSTNVPQHGMCMEYQMKRASSKRVVTQKVLSVIAECLDQFGPGCTGVQKILNARCPLVRFAHLPSGLQCDLTASNRVGMQSTELLYFLGELDPRVRPLVFTVRCWARTHGVTSSMTGAWITNFSLTMMVLYFLQRTSPPILPTLNHLQELAEPSEKCVVDGNDCTFTTDFHKISLETNTETLDQLLRGFFEFYSVFVFNKMSINFRKGKEEHKVEPHPLYIQNPFETDLNVSKNVNSTQVDRFVSLCRESAWLLQTGGNLCALLQPLSERQGRKKRKMEQASERMIDILESLRNNHKVKNK